VLAACLPGWKVPAFLYKRSLELRMVFV